VKLRESEVSRLNPQGPTLAISVTWTYITFSDPNVLAELTDGFKEREPLDVAGPCRRSPRWRMSADEVFGVPADTRLDLVSDVRGSSGPFLRDNRRARLLGDERLAYICPVVALAMAA